MAIYDEQQFTKNGVLTPDEYLKVVSTLTDALKQFRITSIRKWLEFKPYEYDKYVEEAHINYDRQFSPIADPDLEPRLNYIPLFFSASFRAEFFPELIREYDLAGAYPQVQVIEFDELGYIQLPTSNFRSIILANYEIEKEVRNRYRKTPLYTELTTHIEIESSFITKPKVEFNSLDDMLIRLEIDCIM